MLKLFFDKIFGQIFDMLCHNNERGHIIIMSQHINEALSHNYDLVCHNN